MSQVDESKIRQDFLSAYDPPLVPHLLAFADRLNALPGGVVMTMARKATCLVDAMIQLGIVRTASHVTSDRVLDMDIGWLRGQRVALVDDLIVSGTTLCRTVDQVIAAGASDVSVHAIVVDTDWWSPDLTMPVEPYVTLNDTSSMAFCTQTIQALNTMPRPYNVDWPLFGSWSISGSAFDRLATLSGWRTTDVTSITQAVRGVTTITCEATDLTLALLNDRCGGPISQVVELAKVRVYARQLVERPGWYAAQALPIVTFAGMSIADVNGMWASTVAHHRIPDLLAAEFTTDASRLRAIQYLSANELGRLWFAAVSQATGNDIDIRMNRSQLNYAFAPHVADMMARSTATGGPFLRLAPPLTVEPIAAVAAHQHELALASKLGTGMAAVQAQLTEPFRQMYRKDELSARRLVLRQGRAALSDRSFTKTIDRLDRGISLAQIEDLAARMPGIKNPRETTSLFLDMAVDQGVAVPITVVNEGRVVRAYRHGEDVRSVETDWRLYGLMLTSLADAWGRRELPASVVESALSIFVRLGVKRMLLTPWHGRLGETGTAGVRYGVTGGTVRIDTSAVVVGTAGRGIVDLLVAGGVLRSGRHKDAYQIGDLPQASATSPAQERGTQDIGWLLGHLIREEGDGGLGVEELILLASGANKLDVPLALAPFVDDVASLIPILLTDVGSTSARRYPARADARNTADLGVRRYRQFLDDTVARVVRRISRQLADQLYRHQWETAGEQLTGGESREVSEDVDALITALGSWLSMAAGYLRLIEVVRPLRRSPRTDRTDELAAEIEQLTRDLPPSADVVRLRNWLSENTAPATQRLATARELADTGLRQLARTAPALIDEIRAGATAVGGVRPVERLTAMMVVYLAQGRPDSIAVEQELRRKIDDHRNRATKGGVKLHPLDFGGVENGLVVAASGADAAVWLGRLCEEIWHDVDAPSTTVALLPDLPKDEHLFHGLGSVDYWGTGFWNRVDAVSRLLPPSRDRRAVVLLPARDGAEERARGLLPWIGSSTPFDLAGDAWVRHPQWSATAVEPARRTREPVVADIGVITILSEETRAIVDLLRRADFYRSDVGPGSRVYHEARITTDHGSLRLVATQAVDRGARSAVLAFEQLRQYCRPAIVVLVGIAGGIHSDLGRGDVVVAHEAIYYDMRKETAAGVTRRGQSRPVPASVRNAINAFFTHHGEPFTTLVSHPDGKARICRALPGPIGSGDAVIAYRESDIRKYLLSFNDKTLALETESGGVAQAFYEEVDADSSLRGWLAIRGISDHADEAKDDSYHEIASRHATAVFEALLPFLCLATAR